MPQPFYGGGIKNLDLSLKVINTSTSNFNFLKNMWSVEIF
jgi:hypothetical protein